MHNKNIKFKKYRIPLIAGLIGIGGIFLFSYLTLVPAQTFAAYDWEGRTLADITTMQEMNAKICENTTEIGTQYQLEDTRINNDGNTRTYWVSKLADGNCWMTQNLDYDIPSVLYKETSNIHSNSIDTHTSEVILNNWLFEKDGSYNAYYDPGDYYYTQVSQGSGCDTSVGLSECSEKGFSASGTNRHYHVGNFYSWNAATASSSIGLTSGQAVDSICPAGWKLPIGGGSTQTGSFNGLLIKYGWSSSDKSAITMNEGKGVYGSPLYFVYGGLIDGGTVNVLGEGKIAVAGNRGFYWSSTPNSFYRVAYALHFSDAIPIPNGGDYGDRYVGGSVRCVNDANVLPKPLLDDNQSNLTITVSPTISLDVTADAIMEDATFTKVSTSNIVANVSSNYQYTVSLSTNQSNLELATPVSGQNIPMIKAGENVVAGTNGWGIMQKMSALDNTMLGSTVDNINNTYSPVGENDEQIVFYKSAGPEALTDQTNPANPLTLKVGVGISPKLPQGTYSTTVTLTASTY